jgi:predicted nucleic acid-binding protein
MERTAVLNSSPWIFLSKLSAIHSALDLFQQVYIPLSVSEEIFSKKDESAAILDELRTKGRVDILKAENSRLAEALGFRLGRGEAEAIAIALEREADLVCLDDHAARTEAMRLGLEVKGTLGIMKRSMELGNFRSDTKALLQNLKRVDFQGQ